MTLSVSIDLVSSSARVTSVKFHKRQFVTEGHPDTKIGPGTPGSDKNYKNKKTIKTIKTLKTIKSIKTLKTINETLSFI